MPISKRAYSDAEKQEREQKILDAAETLLAEKSYSSINMSEVARTADIAKGTLYLYFQTKEELFLTLFQRKFSVLMDGIKTEISALDTPVDKYAVRDIFVQRTIGEKQLMRLLALSNIIFEHNISYEKAREYKLSLGQFAFDMGTLLEEKLNLKDGQGLQVMYRLYVFIVGMENLANPAPIIQQVYENETDIQHPDLEQELTDLLTLVLDAL